MLLPVAGCWLLCFAFVAGAVAVIRAGAVGDCNATAERRAFIMFVYTYATMRVAVAVLVVSVVGVAVADAASVPVAVGVVIIRPKKAGIIKK